MKVSDPTGWARLWQTIQREGAYQILTAGTEPRRWYYRSHLPSMIMKASQVLWAEAQVAAPTSSPPPGDRVELRVAKLLAFPGPLERQERARLRASKLTS